MSDLLTKGFIFGSNVYWSLKHKYQNDEVDTFNGQTTEERLEEFLMIDGKYDSIADYAIQKLEPIKYIFTGIGTIGTAVFGAMGRAMLTILNEDYDFDPLYSSAQPVGRTIWCNSPFRAVISVGESRSWAGHSRWNLYMSEAPRPQYWFKTGAGVAAGVGNWHSPLVP
jgi:hypothetical protein